ncbi:M23 family metallopeptidase [Parerythrobacter aurantius]|uniref:M23 family metallopeptidase n=1 Tax=Parerythrobacter aurantius TaxID=3127706 RepID=UPI003255BA76
MSALGNLDRLATIVVTAAVTSGLWYAGTSGLLELKRGPGSVPEIDETSGTPDGPAAAPRSLETRKEELPTAGGNLELIIPVAGTEPAALVDTFYDARGEGSRLHEAIDIMAPTGTPVIAAAEGTVERLFRSAAGGLTVYLRSPDRQTIYYYAHLDRYAAGLREGQIVKAGSPLGAVGWTGNASEDAPHLHFAIMRTTADADWWEPANPINPYPLLTAPR